MVALQYIEVKIIWKVITFQVGRRGISVPSSRSLRKGCWVLWPVRGSLLTAMTPWSLRSGRTSALISTLRCGLTGRWTRTHFISCKNAPKGIKYQKLGRNSLKSRSTYTGNFKKKIAMSDEENIFLRLYLACVAGGIVVPGVLSWWWSLAAIFVSSRNCWGGALRDETKTTPREKNLHAPRKLQQSPVNPASYAN